MGFDLGREINAAILLRKLTQHHTANHCILFITAITMPSNIPLEVLQSLNWEDAVPPDDPRFVNTDVARGENVQLRLTRKFGIDTARQKLFAPATKHVLFFGPIGCGKSTELLRLHASLRQSKLLYPITLNLRNEVDINNLQYSDMLMALATALVQELAERHIHVAKEELNKLSNWFKEHVETQEGMRELSAEIESKASAEMGIPFLAKFMTQITAKFKNSSTNKSTLREVLRNSFTQFALAFNALILAAEKGIQEKGLGQRLLLIVDGTDKITLIDAKRLFVDDTEQLLAIHALVLYTAPISLKYGGTTHSKLDTDNVLPMIKLKDQAGNLMPEAWQTMRNILVERIDLTVFEDPASVDKIIEYSGGHPRELLRIVGLACELTDTDMISPATIERAADKLADEFRYWLAPEDYAFLAATDFAKGEFIGMDQRSSNLLWRLALLQYNNGSWRLSHPLLRRLAEYKKALALLDAATT